jgi:hypothetical protein
MTESLFGGRFNRLLQQNRPQADMGGSRFAAAQTDPWPHSNARISLL